MKKTSTFLVFGLFCLSNVAAAATAYDCTLSATRYPDIARTETTKFTFAENEQKKTVLIAAMPGSDQYKNRPELYLVLDRMGNGPGFGSNMISVQFTYENVGHSPVVTHYAQEGALIFAFVNGRALSTSETDPQLPETKALESAKSYKKRVRQELDNSDKAVREWQPKGGVRLTCEPQES